MQICLFLQVLGEGSWCVFGPQREQGCLVDEQARSPTWRLGHGMQLLHVVCSQQACRCTIEVRPAQNEVGFSLGVSVSFSSYDYIIFWLNLLQLNKPLFSDISSVHHLEATCNVRSLKCCQASSIIQHSKTSIHRIAQAAFWSPGALALAPRADEELLKGAVPQLPDIVRLWTWLTNPVSFRLMKELSLTESFICSSRQDRHTFGVKQFSFDCNTNYLF